MNYAEEEQSVMGKAYDSRLMKRLLKYIYPYRYYGLLAVILLLIMTLLQLAGPYLMKIAIDTYMAQKDLAGLKWIVLIFLGVLIARGIFQFAQNILMEWIGQKIMAQLRLHIFSHLQRLPMQFFDRNPVGRLVTRVTSDVDTMNELFTSGFISIFGDLFTLFGIIIVMLHLNWKLALLTFSILPFLAGATFYIRIKLRNNFREIRVRIARINAFLQENITGMSTVQNFNREKRNFYQFDQLNHHHLEAQLETVYYFSMFFPVVEFLLSVAISMIIWYGGKNIILGIESYGALLAFIQYVERFFRPLSQLAEKYNIMQAAMASSERVFKLLDEPLVIHSPENPLRMPSIKGAIEFNEVYFHYNSLDGENNTDRYILDNISFTVAPGEKVAIVGSTGAGKTTIINLLTRFYDIQKGKILIDSNNIKNFELRTLRSNIGIVLQDVFIFARDIASNIRLGNHEISQENVIQAARDVHLHKFIKTLPNQYDEKLTERGSTLSTGQRQLLAFARALAFDPQILILDEATSSVDPETELLIQQALLRLMENRTSLIIAHRLSTIEHVDKVIVLHKGKIRQVGTHQELLSQEGIYKRLYQLQYVS